VCSAGSRIFVQEGIYDEFLAAFTEAAKAIGAATGDPFAEGTRHGPQVSQTQFDVRSLSESSALSLISLAQILACHGIH
jgi:acyl-CoA reductase-like NAD-dependent aldehyde dehydrogenase